MSRKPSFFNNNYRQLVNLCKENGYEIEEIDYGSQYRVYGATHIIDIWPARMVHHRISGEDIKAIEPYSHELDWEFNKKQVGQLLSTGVFK